MNVRSRDTDQCQTNFWAPRASPPSPSGEAPLALKSALADRSRFGTAIGQHECSTEAAGEVEPTLTVPAMEPNASLKLHQHEKFTYFFILGHNLWPSAVESTPLDRTRGLLK
jgi:hypothetical protein